MSDDAHPFAREILAKLPCRKCGGEMKPGIATGQTYTSGELDFPGDTHAVTMSAGGPGCVIECLKCEKCGRSVT